MTPERTPKSEEPLVDDKAGTTPWDDARERLANPEPGRHNWLATVRPDGWPHLMPVLTFWMDGALHFVAGEGTQKGRNLAADGWCAIGTESRELPSLDIVVEGRAEPLSDADAVRRITEQFNASGWPLEARGVEVHGPNAPTGAHRRTESSAWSRSRRSASRERTGWNSSSRRNCRARHDGPSTTEDVG